MKFNFVILVISILISVACFATGAYDWIVVGSFWAFSAILATINLLMERKDRE